MTQSSKKNYEKYLCWICFAVTAIILIAPLWNKAQIFGHDAWYHITRIEALKEQILDGHPFSRINYFFYQGEGYASSLCYPDLLLYIPALFRIAGLNINLSYNIFLMLCAVACYITTFYAAKKMTGNSLASTICAMIFSLSQYHLDNILTRGAVGEIQAFIFIPLVVYGIYNFLYEDFSRPTIMAIGFIGLVLSHTITTFLAILIYGIIMLVNFKKIFENKNRLIKLILTAGTVLLCTCYYWIPLFELMTKMDLKVSHPTRIVSESAIDFNYLISDVKMKDNIIGMGISVFIFLVLRFAIRRNDYKDKELKLLKAGDLFAITGVACAVCSTKTLPWKLFDKTILNSIQFTWRLFIVASVFLSFASCIYLMLVLSKNPKHKYNLYSIVAVTICILAVVHSNAVNPSYKYRSDNYFYETTNYNDSYDGTCRTGGAEWWPYLTLKNKEKALDQCDIVKDQSGNTYAYTKDGTTVTVEIDNTKSYIETIQAPLVYYIGYSAEFADTAGNITKLDVKGTEDCGLCVTNIPQGTSGILKFYYKGTFLQKLSLAVTLLTIIGLVAVFALRKTKLYKR